MSARFEIAERIADAVLFEGYVLYPYRASSAKNRVRWQFGVVAPRSPREDGEPSSAETECLCLYQPETRLSIRVRFLRPHRAAGPRAWLEGVTQAIDLDEVLLNPLPLERRHALHGGEVDACVTLHAERRGRFVKLRVRLENCEPWCAVFDTDRDAMLERSLVGAHLLLAVEPGTFVSLLDPPADALDEASACRSRYAWPVLVGDRAASNLMLVSPIVLHDFPVVAPENGGDLGDLCDAAEIDEIVRSWAEIERYHRFRAM